MQYFKPEEFQGWFDQLSPALKSNLDALRGKWGRPIVVSPAPGAVGRRLGGTATSQHNVDRWGEVRAVDVMPYGISTASDARLFRCLAEDCGFTGIGFYPDWNPRPGFHLDIRITEREGYVAQWGGVKQNEEQVYVGMAEALNTFERAGG